MIERYCMNKNRQTTQNTMPPASAVVSKALNRRQKDGPADEVDLPTTAYPPGTMG